MSYRHLYREPYAVDSRSALYSREQRYDQDNYARRHEDSRGRPRGGTFRGKNSSRGSYHPEHRNRGRGGYGRGSHADRITRYRREDHYRATDSLAHPPAVQPPKHQSDRPETPLLIAKSPSQPVVSSPPNPNALDSLDKLLRFKANADATRRQTDVEPGQLALVAQSFLKAKSGKFTSSPASSVETPEPGEVIEPPLEDAQSRAAILKASLLKKRKNEHSHVQVKTELAGEDSHNPATDRSSPKRARVEHGRAAATKTHEHSREYVSDHRPSVGNFVPSRYRTFPRRDDQGRSPSEQRRGSGHADNLLSRISERPSAQDVGYPSDSTFRYARDSVPPTSCDCRKEPANGRGPSWDGAYRHGDFPEPRHDRAPSLRKVEYTRPPEAAPVPAPNPVASEVFATLAALKAQIAKLEAQLPVPLVGRVAISPTQTGSRDRSSLAETRGSGRYRSQITRRSISPSRLPPLPVEGAKPTSRLAPRDGRVKYVFDETRDGKTPPRDVTYNMPAERRFSGARDYSQPDPHPSNPAAKAYDRVREIRYQRDQYNAWGRQHYEISATRGGHAGRRGRGGKRGH